MRLYRFVLPLVMTFSLLVSFFTLVFNEHEKHSVLPLPTDTKVLSKEEDESLEQVKRLEWIERIHKAAPGVDWREIEKQNSLQSYLLNINRSRAKDGSTLISVGNDILQGVWTEKGSDNLAGRTHTADYDTINHKIYLGSAGGNIWKGNLDGSGWEVLNDQLQFESIQVVRSIRRNKTHRILAATSRKSIYYSDDDGLTWEESEGLGELAGSNEGIIRTQVRDDSLATVYCLVAERVAPSQIRVHSLFKSTDLGSNFERVATIPETNNINSNRSDMWVAQYGLCDVYITSGNNSFKYDVEEDTLIQTASYPNNVVGYTMVAGHLAQTGEVYLYTYLDGLIFRSADEGNTWEQKTDLDKSPFFKTSFSASVVIPDRLFFGDIECYRSDNGGSAWFKINDWFDYYDDIVSKLHADIPSVNSLLGENGEEFYLINTDGGVYRSPNGTQVVNISQSGLNISQYYSSLTSSFDTNYVFLGSQDQGYQRAFPDEGGLLSPEQVISGDYGHLVSGDQGSSLWMVYPGFAIFYPNAADDYGITWDFDGNNNFWIPPLMSDPYDEQAVYMANGNRITRLKQTGDNITANNLSTVFVGDISALAFSPINPEYWYAYTESGRFYLSVDAGNSWEFFNLAGGPGSNYLYGACIYPSRKDLGEVWVSGSGYSNAPVYFSNNNGQNFTEKSTGLPSTMAFRLAGTPADEFIFAATEAGPYVFIDESNEWFALDEGIAPDQTYWSVEYIDDMKVARFVTYGRGAWDFRIQNILSIPETEVENLTVYPNPASSQINVKIENSKSFSYELFSLDGRSMINGVSNNGNAIIRCSNLSNGVYLLKVNANNNSNVKKIVVKH